jgi:hypothetical protein
VVTSFFNGITFGTNIEFSDVNDQAITHQQTYLWMDNYFSKNPFISVVEGSVELMNERSNGRFNKRSLNKQ